MTDIAVGNDWRAGFKINWHGFRVECTANVRHLIMTPAHGLLADQAE
jgi:hypothetical protein